MAWLDGHSQGRGEGPNLAKTDQQDLLDQSSLEPMIHGGKRFFALDVIGNALPTEKTKIPLDRTVRQLLALLQSDGRLSHAEIGRRLKLSATTVAERIRTLEADGVIMSYGAMVEPRRVGLPILAMVTLTAEGERCRRLPEAVAAHPEVLSCHRLAGEVSALLEVAVPSVAALEALVDRLGVYGKTTTMLVLSTTFDRRPLPLGAMGAI